MSITEDKRKELEERFDSILLGVQRDGIGKLIEYLHTTDFYTAPASTRYHSSYEGGLLAHSLNVYDMLKAKMATDLWKDRGYSDDTIAIVSLCHDLCKVNFYDVEMRNRKNDEGKWEQYPFYITNDRSPYGHGEKSAMMTGHFIKLSAEEQYAIRWHMGFSEPRENYGYLGKAMELYPLIVALHESDLEATYLLESKDDED